MTTEKLLNTLRTRLAFVTSLLDLRTTQRPPSAMTGLQWIGETNALTAERQFLTDLIAQVDREGVQP